LNLLAIQARVRHVLLWSLPIAALVFALVWVLFVASGTTFGSAVHDPKDFFITFLNSVTIAGLYFTVASGLTLIFGLMRVVNMAHGSLFLLGGYIALRLQRDFVGQGSAFGLTSSQISLGNWVFPLLIAAACIAIFGLLMQQIFLRWNQGQELRQALITIAISIIAADQILAHFVEGGASDISWPTQLGEDKFAHIGATTYSWARLFMLIFGVCVGIALWLWLKRTRTGMIIRAGVDDRAMVSALGINVQVVFGIAFVVGSLLAGAGGVIGGSFAGLDVGVDNQWLLNSLVVVIIGGMGSLGGAAVASLLYGFVTNYSAAYLPSNATFYSIIFTFVLLAVVLAVRPFGLFGRAA
jgi:branched-chain amino acid transport system permease protein